LVDNVAIARRYLAAPEAGASFDEVAAFLTEDIVQEEFPNRLSPAGARRDLAGMREAAEKGRRIMRAQRYEIVNALAQGDAVALEVRWTGTIAVPFDTLPAGGEIRARFALILEFRGGRIARQRNYDSIEPW
jgi:ketosteroid isomerase-like protein